MWADGREGALQQSALVEDGRTNKNGYRGALRALEAVGFLLLLWSLPYSRGRRREGGEWVGGCWQLAVFRRQQKVKMTAVGEWRRRAVTP